MGTTKHQLATAPSRLADALFTPVQQRVLALLFGQPGRRFQSAELIRLAGSGTGATHRLLKRWAESGLVSVTIDGHQKYYQANGESPVFGELVGLVQKMVGLIGPLREALAPVADRIEAAIVYGSVASGQDQAQSDIDLMVIGEELDYQTVFEAVQPAERKLGRPVNPNLMTLREWRSKREQPDSFEARLVGKPRLFVLGSDDDIR
ncbi:MAG: nucleotidyltransferase domain-containing protein [Acidobacteria bacterium]|nr:MAG: nucleotidyltransferase domain-containing protein [Acidobacteriota bacterium]